MYSSVLAEKQLGITGSVKFKPMLFKEHLLSYHLWPLEKR